MQTLLVAAVTKIVEIVLKYLIEWGERSIAKQQEIKRKMEEYKASKEASNKKAENYEKDPSPDNRNDIP